LHVRQSGNHLLEQPNLFTAHWEDQETPESNCAWCARFLRDPIATGSSPVYHKVGMGSYAFPGRGNRSGCDADMTFTSSRTRSRQHPIRSGLKLVKRFSIARFLPSHRPLRPDPPEAASFGADRQGAEKADHRHGPCARPKPTCCRSTTRPINLRRLHVRPKHQNEAM